MKVIEKKKIYRGMVEIRDYELEKVLANNQSIDFVYNGQHMVLNPDELKEKKHFINTQHSIINKGQTYGIWGYSWRPNEIK